MLSPLGAKWSELPGNEGLPQHIKDAIDDPDFQHDTLEALTQLKAGRGISLAEFRAKHPPPRSETPLRVTQTNRADSL